MSDARHVYAQGNDGYDDDGNIYSYAAIDIDSNYNLYTDSFSELDFEADEDINGVYDEIKVDQDNDVFYDDNAAPDDYYSEYPEQEFDSVPTGHEYGVASVGWACYDNGEGDCDWYPETYAYAPVNVQFPPPLISNISPSSFIQGDQGTNFIISGSNFIESSTDQLMLNVHGGNNPFTIISAPSTCTSSCTATFSYDFSGYPTGTYTLSVSNNEGEESDYVSFTVVAAASQWPADPCAIDSSPNSTFSSFVSTGVPGGGTVGISLSGAAYSTISQAVPYGPFSTPSSIASSIAALVTYNYKQSGLTARAFGPNVVYSGKSAVGAASYVISGPSITVDSSASAKSSASLACSEAPPSPPPVCGRVNPNYVLAVLHDSVNWVNEGMNYGRMISYSLENKPSSPGLGTAVNFQSSITEHLSVAMAYGKTTTSNISGEFDDVLGNTAANQSGVYTTERCFTVTSPTKGNLGQVVSYDAAGTHTSDHIKITPSTKTTILNNWTYSNGSPKNIAIP